MEYIQISSSYYMEWDKIQQEDCDIEYRICSTLKKNNLKWPSFFNEYLNDEQQCHIQPIE
jgi:hypothetical protein